VLDRIEFRELASGDRRRGLARFAHRPLAHAIAAAALDQIQMDVVLMVAVGAGAEHRREVPTSRFLQLRAQILADIHVG
jgi:hypothetical protein